jgi:hypothetical protein
MVFGDTSALYFWIAKKWFPNSSAKALESLGCLHIAGV